MFQLNWFIGFISKCPFMYFIVNMYYLYRKTVFYISQKLKILNRNCLVNVKLKFKEFFLLSLMWLIVLDLLFMNVILKPSGAHAHVWTCNEFCKSSTVYQSEWASLNMRLKPLVILFGFLVHFVLLPVTRNHIFSRQTDCLAISSLCKWTVIEANLFILLIWWTMMLIELFDYFTWINELIFLLENYCYFECFYFTFIIPLVIKKVALYK